MRHEVQPVATPSIVQYAYARSGAYSAGSSQTVTATLAKPAALGNQLFLIATASTYSGVNAGITPPAGSVAVPGAYGNYGGAEGSWAWRLPVNRAGMTVISLTQAQSLVNLAVIEVSRGAALTAASSNLGTYTTSTASCPAVSRAGAFARFGMIQTDGNGTTPTGMTPATVSPLHLFTGSSSFGGNTESGHNGYLFSVPAALTGQSNMQTAANNTTGCVEVALYAH
ncbi:MAG: hypothetical protein ACRYGG_06170 [Janthinobacterium lividum]